MADRYTMKNVEARVENLNARLEAYGSKCRVYTQGANGYTNLYETRATNKDYSRHITTGTKREICEYLSAMMQGIMLVKT